MKNGKYIRRITTLGLIVIFALQSIWLHNTYVLIKNTINEDCSSILNKAILKTANFVELPEETQIVGSPANDSIPLVTFLCDGIHKLGVELPICKIDSIAGVF